MDDERTPLIGSNSIHCSQGKVSIEPDARTHNEDTSPDIKSVGTYQDDASQFRHSGQHSMVDSCEQVTLTWENVNAHLKTQDRLFSRGRDQKDSWKHILRNVNGIVRPGTLLAILGASGSGKTTLLNTLTSRTTSSRLWINGDIRVNGINVGRGIRNISAYVQQDDLFIATMTVKEHLTFRALLRMEKCLTKARRLKRVDEVILEFGLTKCADSIIGNPEDQKGISGGEMRRLSFASEILSNPPLLFCDEATSGLDAYMAENIVQTLKTMASKGKTILCTIHQPSSEVYALFDQVLIMAEGRTAFLGEATEALVFMKNNGYPCPANFNPADFFIHTLAIVPDQEAGCRARVEAICDAFENSKIAKDLAENSQNANSHPKFDGILVEEAFSNTSRYESSWCEQFAAVFMRCLRTTVREPMVIKVRLAQTTVIALILGIIYLRQDIDQEGVMNVNGALFLFLLNATWVNMFAVANTFPIEQPVFLREYGIGLYRVDVYFICKMIAELPWFIIIPIIWNSVAYFMIGLYESAEAFFICCAVLILVSNVSVSFGYLISTVSNSVSTALALAPPFLVLFVLFGGFFLNTGSVADYFIWLKYLSWFSFSNELLAVNQWENIDSIGCPVNTTENPCDRRCLFKDGESVIDYLNFEQNNTVPDYSILFGLLVGYRLVAFLILLVKARRSRA